MQGLPSTAASADTLMEIERTSAFLPERYLFLETDLDVLGCSSDADRAKLQRQILTNAKHKGKIFVKEMNHLASLFNELIATK